MTSWLEQSSAMWVAAVLALMLGAALQANPDQGGGAAPTQAPAPATQKPDPAGPVRDANGAVIGFTSLAEIPGTPWRIHDAARPHPRVITPGSTASAPPS